MKPQVDRIKKVFKGDERSAVAIIFTLLTKRFNLEQKGFFIVKDVENEILMKIVK